MPRIHCPALEGPTVSVCEQSGWRACVECLLREHMGLVY